MIKRDYFASYLIIRDNYIAAVGNTTIQTQSFLPKNIHELMADFENEACLRRQLVTDEILMLSIVRVN